jgi:hypothetical protein
LASEITLPKHLTGPVPAPTTISLCGLIILLFSIERFELAPPAIQMAAFLGH